MSAYNSSAELAATYLRTRSAYQDRETAKTELKKLGPRTPRRQLGTATYHPAHEVFLAFEALIASGHNR
jgi:hypothetical protein